MLSQILHHAGLGLGSVVLGGVGVIAAYTVVAWPLKLFTRYDPKMRKGKYGSRKTIHGAVVNASEILWKAAFGLSGAVGGLAAVGYAVSAVLP